MCKTLFPSLILLLFCYYSKAQERYIIPKIDAEIVFDCKPDEEIWLEIPSLPFIMHQPVYGKEPSEKTECMIFFNDDYLYVGANIYYTDISFMASVGKQRDYFSMKCDWFGIHLDSFNDNENGMAFYTNPNGLRFDATVKNDASAGLEDINISWNTFWDVSTSHDHGGWYMEMRIPVSSLRFQDEDGFVEMGLTVVRFIPKKSEVITFPPIDPKHENSYWKPSLAAPIELIGLRPGKPIYLTPYLIGGIQQNHFLNEAETSYEREITPKLDAGLDFKYGLTKNLTLDLTLNTDFAQVEADEQQINLTRYSIFFPEKRPFFLEKSDVFDFDLLGGNKLFYSRRIGLHEGSVVRIIGGARVTGSFLHCPGAISVHSC